VTVTVPAGTVQVTALDRVTGSKRERTVRIVAGECGEVSFADEDS